MNRPDAGCVDENTHNALSRNLMAKDEFKNLGFGEEKPQEIPKGGGKKGELNW